MQDQTLCLAQRHHLRCRCGDLLTRVPQPADDEWTYRSETTGDTVKRVPNAEVAFFGWDRLARERPATYSVLSARAGMGMLDEYHYHWPEDCPEPHDLTALGILQWCCDQPMRYAPSGWVCRATPTHRKDRTP